MKLLTFALLAFTAMTSVAALPGGTKYVFILQVDPFPVT